ncbi:unnamed protein product [Prorocentrum cordatum]|uniref:Uncharacterized protein n=1 Tax=Prorocentrum cordatum TaxID=2364126 RepID=A0ABN9PGG0_9DINO|nr:unnamed protein product [Polarella glacialis]
MVSALSRHARRTEGRFRQPFSPERPHPLQGGRWHSECHPDEEEDEGDEEEKKEEEEEEEGQVRIAMGSGVRASPCRRRRAARLGTRAPLRRGGARGANTEKRRCKTYVENMSENTPLPTKKASCPQCHGTHWRPCWAPRGP